MGPALAGPRDLETSRIRPAYTVPYLPAYRPHPGVTAMTKFLKALLIEEDGATMVEYALMVALIAAAAVTVVGALSTALNAKFTSVTTALGGGS